MELVIGNPAAHAAGRRYIERDLNRSFDPRLLADPAEAALEVERARQLLELHGPEAADPCRVALDLHSTTAAMGNCLVVYGRRPPDLALAAGLQRGLGLPIYLHEGDASQSGFLVERWPCGLVVEVGPVPAGSRAGGDLPPECPGPGDGAGGAGRRPPGPAASPPGAGGASPSRQPRPPPPPRWIPLAAVVHPLRQHRDWQPLHPGDPLFLGPDGSPITYDPPAGLAAEAVWAVFINEAAYGEKGIALSLTRREVWPVPAAWGEELEELAGGLEPA